jgi:predicted aldo/keto reductase-like oxidoreductase
MVCSPSFLADRMAGPLVDTIPAGLTWCWIKRIASLSLVAGKRNNVVIATKFGYFGNEATKTLHGTNVTPDYIERACEASLKRLNTDYIDVYQLHEWNLLIADVESQLKKFFFINQTQP